VKGKRPIVKLAQWLSVSDKAMKEELAKRSGCSLNYLYVLAGGHRENPRVRLAMAIVGAANRIRAKIFDALILSSVQGEADLNSAIIPPLLTLEDIANVRSQDAADDNGQG